MDRVRKQLCAEDESVRRYTGKNIGVAILDSGVYEHPDLMGRIKAFYNFLVDKKHADYMVDDYGHGTHV